MLRLSEAQQTIVGPHAKGRLRSINGSFRHQFAAKPTADLDPLRQVDGQAVKIEVGQGGLNIQAGSLGPATVAAYPGPGLCQTELRRPCEGLGQLYLGGPVELPGTEVILTQIEL